MGEAKRFARALTNTDTPESRKVLGALTGNGNPLLAMGQDKSLSTNIVSGHVPIPLFGMAGPRLRKLSGITGLLTFPSP
jgi:hypothetical protein